jgi:hypothetical protein
MVLMKFAAAARPPHIAQDASMETPRLVDLRVDIGAGKVSLSSRDGQVLYAKSMLNAALSNMKTRRFAESIQRMTA